MDIYTDFTQLEKSSSPNNYLACPAKRCQNADLVIPLFKTPVISLEKKISDIMATLPRTKLIYQHKDSHFSHYVQRTKWLRFPDDIYIQVKQINNEAGLFIYSKARYGYYDFNVNKNRVTDILTKLANND